MKMFKRAKVIMSVGVMVMGVLAVVDEESSKKHFEPLCNIMRAATGLWQTVSDPDQFSNEVLTDLGKKIEKTLFGLMWEGDGKGHWNLPENFKKGNPRRAAVCGLNSISHDMPAASESLASTIFCLCTPTSADSKNLCGFDVQDSENWLGNKDSNVKKLFEEVWGNDFKIGAKEHCEGTYSSTIKEAKENLNTNLTVLENLLKTTEVLGKNSKICEGKTPCANVTKKPTWLQKLREITELTLKPLPPPQKIPHPRTTSSTETTNAVAPEPEPASPPAPTTVSASSQAREEEPKKETRKAPGEKQKTDPKMAPVPEPERKHTVTHQNQEENHPVVQENETSDYYKTSPKWPLWAALLI